MAYFSWSDDFVVGVKEIDEQHKRLVEMINILHDALVAQRGKETLGTTVNGMLDYAATHFETEERYMTLYRYPDFVAHKFEHDGFAVKAADLKRRVDGNRFVLTLEVLYFLKEWLQNHILVTDKKYMKHFRDHGVW